MRHKLLAANWKMHGDLARLKQLISDIKSAGVKEKISKNRVLSVFPPFVYLAQLHESLADTLIQLGAQDVSQAQEGAYTGQISSKMLKEFNVKFVLIGHSERRNYCQESNAQLIKKIQQACVMEITPVLCIGESLEEYQAGKTLTVLEEQIQQVFSQLNKKELESLVLAYEPIWAIGSGLAATPEHANTVHKACREMIKQFNEDIAELIPILYGGSVNEKNAAELFNMSDIDGALVGGASLNAEAFTEICKQFFNNNQH